MQITAKASELVGTTVEKVSLVRHAANRRPFQILKSAPLPADGSLNGLAARVQKMFKQAEPKIVAVLVNKSAAKAAFPMIVEAGLRVELENAAALTDNVIVLKQDGYNAETAGDIIALSEDVALVLDQSDIAKSFCSWHASSDFTETMQSQAFYPSLRMATEALMDTVYAIGGNADTPAEMGEKLDTAIDAFKKYVLGLHKTLPVEVFRAAQKLAQDFEGSTVATTDTVSKHEGDPMKPNTAALREAVNGDLAGLFKSDEAPDAAAVAAAEADAAAAAAAAETTAAADAAEGDASATDAPAADATTTDAAPAPEGTDTPAATEGEGAVAKTEQAAVDTVAILTAVKEALAPLHKSVEDLNLQVASLTSANTALGERVAKAETASATAVRKADNTVVIHDVASDLGSTLHTRHSDPTQVRKSQQPESVFKGLFPNLDALEEAARAQNGGK